MNPPHQQITELVMQHPDIPGDPSAYYPAAPMHTYQPMQPVTLGHPHPQSNASCMQMSYAPPQPSIPSMPVDHHQPQPQPQPQVQAQVQLPSMKQCKCKCTCDASVTMIVPHPPAPAAPAAAATAPAKPTKPKSSKSSKRSNPLTLPDSPSKTPLAKVAGPAQAPVPLVEELHRFSCRICGKTFKLKGAVVVHMRVHSLERKHSCNFCDMKFKDTNSLRQHVRRHTGERPYKCSYCDKAFKQQSGLMQHERLHTGERPYVCRFCQRTFVQKNHVDRHERAHTGDKPYTCRHCGAAFVDRSGLNQHALSQHGEEPLRLTPAGMEPRGSGRPKKLAEGVEELDNPVFVPKKKQSVVEEEAEEVDDLEERGEVVNEGQEVKLEECVQDDEEAATGMNKGRMKKGAAKRKAVTKMPKATKVRNRRRQEEDNPQKALWKAGLAPHPGGRPPKHRADVVVLPAPVSIVRTGRKRMPQALVEDLALLPPRKDLFRGRGRPRKDEQLAMLEAGNRAMQGAVQQDPSSGAGGGGGGEVDFALQGQMIGVSGAEVGHL